MNTQTRTAFLFAGVVALGAVSLPSCGSGGPGVVTDGESGDVTLALALPGGTLLNSVSYSVSGPMGFTRTGTIDVSHSATISLLLSLPLGGPYTFTLSGSTTDGSVACAGSSSAFSVAAGQLNKVTVNLTCHEGVRTGSVLVNGKLNICPQIDAVSASPNEVIVGSSISLASSAHDSDAGPSALAYSWSASSGTFSSATAQNPTFTCTVPGTATITLNVSDGDMALGCADTRTFSVTCTKATTTMAVFGDWPYGNIINTAASFIAQVNADPDVDLVVHVGDIHSGSQPCNAAYNKTIFDFFQTFADPFVYTPGDNEWTDCQKVKEMSSGAPLDELAKVRALFFPTAGKTLGGAPRVVTSQANAFDVFHPEDAAYVENVMWEQSSVLFVTLNIPGSNDDHLPWAAPFSDPAAQADEIAKRDAANSRWLARAFA